MKDLEQQVLNEVNQAISESIKKRLTDYGSPLHKLVDKAVERHMLAIESLMDEAIAGAVLNKEFRSQVIEAVQHKIARELANSFGEGAFKRAVDSLKANPTLKAKCVLAIERILEEKP